MVARSQPKHSRGFSLVEMLIVVATIGALTSMSLALFETFIGSSSTHLTADKLIDALGHARISSLSQKQDGAWGVKLLPVEQKAVVFLGSSYGARKAAFDTDFPYEDGVSVVSQLSPPAGADEVVFSSDIGTPSAYGTIVITAGGVQREVVVELTEVGIALKQGDKFTICHYPPGNPSNPQTISISPNAWPAHKKHGDTIGPCPPSSPPAGPPNGLIAYWKFDEASGTTTADASGRGHTGNLQGGADFAVGEGLTGNAISLDGVDDWVSVPDHSDFDFGSAFTITAWVYNPFSSPSWPAVLKRKAGAGDELAYGLYFFNSTVNPNKTTAFVNVGGTDVTVGGCPMCTMGSPTWAMLTLIYDGSKLFLYGDDQLMDSVAATGNVANTTGPLGIGGHLTFGEYTPRKMDEVCIFGRALSEPELTILKNQTKTCDEL